MSKKIFLLGMLLLALTACDGSKNPDKMSQKGLTDKDERMLRLAESTRAAGDVETAKGIYRQLVTTSTSAVSAHLSLAGILVTQQKPQDALEVLKVAEKLQPKNVEVLKELANVMIMLGTPAEALLVLEKAMVLAPNDARLYNSQGIALDMKDDRVKAQESYKKAISLANENTGYIENNLAMSYIMTRKLKEASELLAKVANSPQATPTTRQNLALAYGLMGEREKSLFWGLKDLPPALAEQNQEIYAALASSTGFSAPDTSVKPVTVIESPLPEKLPELTEAQKNALKEAVQYMQSGKVPPSLQKQGQSTPKKPESFSAKPENTSSVKLKEAESKKPAAAPAKDDKKQGMKKSGDDAAKKPEVKKAP